MFTILFHHHNHAGRERSGVIRHVAISLESIPIISGQSVSGADPDEAFAVANNAGEDVVRRKALGGCEAVEVEDGEELFLGGKKRDGCEHQEKAQQSDPKVANSAEMSDVTGWQENQVPPC
jgi:hypothetical protein